MRLALGSRFGETATCMWSTLNQAREQGSLIDLKREGVERGFIRGFVAALSADHVVLSLVDDLCNFNGTSILEVDHVSFVRWDTEVLQAWARVLQESPSSPASVRHVDLSSWESVVRSVVGQEKVVTLHRERIDDSTCYIGTNIRIEGESVQADEISVEGTIDGYFSLRLGDLTKLDFGGGYELALWRMVQSSAKPES